MKSILITYALVSVAITAQAKPLSFSQAKKVLKEEFRDVPATLYCGCPVKWQGKKAVPDLEACGYKVRKQPKRANRTEFEHVTSAWAMGHQRQCWQEGGRKNCTKTDPVFKFMEGDLHNLFYSVGEANGDRSNYRFSQWREKRGATYGQCDLEVDFKNKRVMPPARSRGIIARAHLYMSSKYPFDLSKSSQQLFEAWDNDYPATSGDWECTRNLRIKAIQGNDNPFITRHCMSK